MLPHFLETQALCATGNWGMTKGFCIGLMKLPFFMVTSFTLRIHCYMLHFQEITISGARFGQTK